MNTKNNLADTNIMLAKFKNLFVVFEKYKQKYIKINTVEVYVNKLLKSI